MLFRHVNDRTFAVKRRSR